MPNALKTQEPRLYDLDFYAWTQDQGAKLRARAAFDSRGDIDWENVAEEIEGVGRSDKREIRSRLEVLLLHLLEWQFQPTRRKAGWRSTIDEQRRRLQLVIEDSPSLRSFPKQALADAFALAVTAAADETELPETSFPSRCPYILDDIMNNSFYPENE